ncbi:MAG: signal recognition particle protein [Bacillota bacterium]|jgi:signal recognition particle subunit SRP54|nr:signal recognition particle protein [Bacillota bacterium]HPZ21691.1 signal recognition particle protein [Bacillota bacterium]HQD19528.1 signal recognition particle protein [Bacillota bacterium]
MLLSGLSQRLQGIIGKLRGRGRLSEADIKAALKDIKLALLEADVNYKVVKDFVAVLQQRCQGSEIMDSLTPGQQVIKIVRDELTNLLGGSASTLTFVRGQSAFMLVGLQGSGKTTTTVKLARMLKAKEKNPVVISLDTYRPAAMEQLAIAAEAAGIPSYRPQGTAPGELAEKALSWAKKSEHDCVFFDTAGRMHLDEGLMAELHQLKGVIQPQEIILVLDVMTGQDAVNIAAGFADRGLTDSIILTKLDSDTRGGAALSVRAVTGKPIKYVGVGEKMEQLEQFHPDRMASQILGMGDILTLIEKAEAAFDLEQAAKLQEKLRTQQFTLQDFRDQLQQFKNIGSMEQIISMLPGGAKLGKLQYDEKEIARIDAIIASMTPAERSSPGIINGSRRKRIAAGSGTNVQQVNKLLKQFAAMQKLMKQLDSKMAKKGRLPFPFKI